MAVQQSPRKPILASALTAVVAVVTLAGSLLADAVVSESAAQHIFNPAWTPHAKFHDAQYIVMSMLLAALALFLLIRSWPATGQRLWIAASMLSTPWLGMFGALLFPGTAAHDPEFGAAPAVGGVNAQLLLAAIMLILLATAATMDVGSRRRARADHSVPPVVSSTRRTSTAPPDLSGRTAPNRYPDE